MNPLLKPVAVCRVEGCGRTQYASGLCQTHHRHMRDRGRAGSIRPYRRHGGEVRINGLSLKAVTAATLQGIAADSAQTLNAVIVDAVEGWVDVIGCRELVRVGELHHPCVRRAGHAGKCRTANGLEWTHG